MGLERVGGWRRACLELGKAAAGVALKNTLCAVDSSVPRDEAGQQPTATSLAPSRPAGLPKLDLVGSAGAQGKAGTWAGRETGEVWCLPPCSRMARD